MAAGGGSGTVFPQSICSEVSVSTEAVLRTVDARSFRQIFGSTRNPVRSYDCLATGVDPFGRAKLLLSRIVISAFAPSVLREPRPPEAGDFAITEH